MTDKKEERKADSTRSINSGQAGSPQEEELLEGVDEAKDLKKELEEIKKERDEYLDGWKRAKADLINYKREERQRLEEIVKFSNEALILDLISVMDSFDLALSTMEKKGPVEKGVYLIRSRLEDFLRHRGLSRIEVKPGQQFNPAFHEVIVAVEGETDKSGNIVEEIEAGYLLYGKVIRPARVKVVK